MVHLNKGLSVNWAGPQISRRTGSASCCPKTGSGLVAIILAIKSSRGESIVFHYPPEAEFTSVEPPPTPEAQVHAGSKLEDGFRLPHSKSGAFDSRISNNLPTIQERESSQDASEDIWLPAWKKILNFDSSLLADIFTPQKSDPKFEMWIDDLVFLGCPVHLRADRSWLGAKSGSLQEFVENFKTLNIGDGNKELAKSIEELERSQASKMESKSQNLHMPSPMTMFHLVFALNTKVDEFYSKHINELYDNVVRQLTLALTYEQAKCEYVWNQCEMMRTIKTKGEANQMGIATVWQEIVKQCDLAEIIQQTYDAISKDGIAHLLVNRRLNLSLVIPKLISSDVIPTDTTLDHPFLSSALSFGIDIADADPLVLPYFSLLLLDDLERLLTTLPTRATPMLVRLLRALDPRKDFHTLSAQLQVPLQEILTLAVDLLKWRFAVPIPPLHERNIYITSPTADRSLLTQHASLFTKTFPDGPTLPHMLSNMSHNVVPYSNLIPDGQLNNYMDYLTWMMKNRWLIQIRTYACVKIRGEIKAAVERDRVEEQNHDPWQSGDDGMLHDELFEDSMISDPHNASRQEKLWLGKLATYHPVADATLFLRVCKYFNGKHAVEKIVVREGIDPRALRRLLEAFDEDLVKSYTW
jgi:nitrogen permease regulator 3-like protein